MKQFHLFLLITLVTIGVLISGSIFAQEAEDIEQKNNSSNASQATLKPVKNQKGVRGFVDANGGGYNDNAPDADGDGIPNGRDEDYSGAKLRKGSNAKGFVDEDGDGINDNMMDADGDGIPNGQDEDFVGRCGQRKQGFVKGNHGQGKGFRNGACSSQNKAAGSK